MTGQSGQFIRGLKRNMPNKSTIRRKNAILIVLILLFMLSLLIPNYMTITGLQVLNNITNNSFSIQPLNETENITIPINLSNNLVENLTLNNTQLENFTSNETINNTLLQSENQTLNNTQLENLTLQLENNSEFEIQASATVIELQITNNTAGLARYVNFTYNVSDGDDNIDNCTLFMNINSVGFSANKTLWEGDIPVNQSDGAPISDWAPYSYGWSINPKGLVIDNSKFWTMGPAGPIHHLDSDLTNLTDAIFVVNPIDYGRYFWGVTTNSSDFWIINPSYDYVQHIDKNGVNITDGFYIAPAGATDTRGVTTNGSDFWVVDVADKWIYHFNSSWDNQTDGFASNSTHPLWGITLDGDNTIWYIVSEFLGTNDYVYHVNLSGSLLPGGFNTNDFKCEQPRGITTPSFILENTGGTPSEFYIACGPDDYSILHITNRVNETTNQSFNKTFGPLAHVVEWKVGCYTNESVQTNSSINTYTVQSTYPTINLQSPGNRTSTTDREINFTYNVTDLNSDISNCTLYLDINNAGFDLDTTLNTTAITETIEQVFNKTLPAADSKIYWKVGCFSNDTEQYNSTAFYLELTTPDPGVETPYKPPPPPRPPPPPPPSPPPPETPEEQTQEEIGDMNLDPGFSGILNNLLLIDIPEDPRDLIINILNETWKINLQNETEIDIDLKRSTILIKENLALGQRPEIPERNIFIYLLILVIALILNHLIGYFYYKYKEHKKKLPKPKYLEKRLGNVYEINTLISRFNKLTKQIKLNISKNKLHIASKQYEKLLLLHNYLMLKLNKQDKEKLHENIIDTYTILKEKIEINYLKKKLTTQKK